MAAHRSWTRLGWLPIVERELRVSALPRVACIENGGCP